MKMVRIEIPVKGVVKACLSAIIMGTIVCGVGTLALSDLLICVLGIVVGIFVYLICNIILKNEVLIMLIERIGKGQ